MIINWVLEREVFNDNHDRFAKAATVAGHKVISWDDFWWETGNWPSLENEYTIFHGSLGNANRIASEVVDFVKEVSTAIIPPDPLYIIDVCNTGGNIKLIEINPFSGADLYACDRKVIISAVEEIIMACDGQQHNGT